ALQPEVGVPITHRIDVETDRLVTAQLRDGVKTEDLDRDALAADAFVKVCADGGKPHATKRDVVVVAGVNTIRTGQFTEGEPCHVLSPNGPIPISPDKVRSYLGDGDSFVKLVLHNGVDITTVAHVGRKTTAELRTALGLGDPPAFHGPECTCGCRKSRGLQLDHKQPVAAGGESSLANEQWLCTPTHKQKTQTERASGVYATNKAPPERPAA